MKLKEIRRDMSQFHYGSIQIPREEKVWEFFAPESQFHYGSIQISKRIQKEFTQTAEASQFHYGSIQILWKQKKQLPMFCSSLNSTMVQFKFNLLNRLKSLGLDESQFHYGSIQIFKKAIYNKNI